MAEARTVAPRLQQVAEGVWIIESEPIKIGGGMPLPIRMTVARLGSGDLLLHSATQYTDDLKSAIEALGPIRHLIAPSIGHWMFLNDWQRASPAVKTWAVPGLKDRAQVRKAGVRVDAELGDDAPEVWPARSIRFWSAVPSSRKSSSFTEQSYASPHRSHPQSRIATIAAAVARSGVCARDVAPNGKAPIYIRGFLKLNRLETARAAARLVAFDPERVIFAHGGWFERDGAAQWRRSLSWLLKT